jgi:hypothetical protein
MCQGTGERLPIVIRNCAMTDITCRRCNGTGWAPCVPAHDQPR